MNNTNSYKDSLKNNTQRPSNSKQHELLQRQSEEQYKDQTNLNNTNSYKNSLKNNTKIKQI